MSMEDPAGDQPVTLFEDAGTGDRMAIYATAQGVSVDLRYDGERLWMTQAQMAALFGRDISVISRHIANILEEGELPEEGSLQKMQTTSGGRPGILYSLDMIISVGYRVSSAQATLFRRWSTAVLVRFATKGFVVDTERLKGAGQRDHIAELRETIREIRASEANLYAELRDICALCQDYDPRAEAARTFYQRTQAKLFHAVVNHTPSEVIAARADPAHPHMGLQAWPKAAIRQQDALVAKNYLAPGEIKELNRLTTLLLDIFEDQLAIGRLTTMADAAALLDQQLKNLNRQRLTGGGQVSHTQAETTARAAYAAFDAERKAAKIAAADAELVALKAAAKGLPKSR
ncbi:MAG: putative cytoplasmic protein [Caulobacter sp.]|nr:putative cytoplasmic protein [Caulobacter sp.]